MFVKGNTSSEYPAFHSKEHSTITLFFAAVTYTGFLKTSFSFLLTKIGFLLLICLTNSKIPPSYLCKYSLIFFEVLSTNFIETPLLRKANSRILFSSIEVLNFIDEKICFEGRKDILVPFFFVFPTFLSGFIEFPSLNLISYSFPSLNIFKSSFSDSYWLYYS